MRKFMAKRWKYLIVGALIADLLALAGLVRFFATVDPEQAIAAELTRIAGTPTPTETATPTPWPGPGKKVRPSPTLPATPMSTDVLAASGFPPGFTPTPRPTREPVYISLPYIFPARARSVDVPVINQIYYPEPFFPPGTNNACGPVALFAALTALRANIEYGRLRDIAVSYGFTHYGISKSGMVNTLTAMNYELGNPYVVEHGNRFAIRDLMKHIRAGGVAIVLIQVQKVNGQFQISTDPYRSFGHFLIIESVNLRTQTIRVAGSTLGMERVPLRDFVRSWSNDPQAVVGPDRVGGWRNYLKNEAAVNWALLVKRRS